MVKRYEHGDTLPGDPWLIRMMIKHPKMFAVYLLLVAAALITLLLVSTNYSIERDARKTQLQFKACLHTEGKQLEAEMLASHWNSEMARDQSKYEAATVCCKKMGRIPLYSELDVICLKPMYVDLSYTR